MKRCTRCGENKVIEAFPYNKRYGRPDSWCLECYRVTNLERYHQNPEPRRVARRAYYAANREAAKQATREWCLANAERRRLYVARYWVEHHAQLIAANKRWREANPDIRKELEGKRRALKLAVPSDFTREQWATLLVQFDFRCAYCGKRPTKLTQDHVIPLSRGGPHTMANIVPACRTCNSRKKARTDWTIKVQPFLPLAG